jgi:xanthine/CO dehydrogenase XdhC/CoxF family maturation factor
MLAENLKALRKAKGLSQEELAARLHVVRQTVSKWEKGRSVPDADLLIRLAEELDTTSAALLGPEGLLWGDLPKGVGPASLQTDCVRQDGLFSMPLPIGERALLFGAGHISQALCPLLVTVGFRPVVFDCRPELATRKLFPTAEEVICGDFTSIKDHLTVTEEDFVVIMTNGHMHDFQVEEQILRGPFAYVGVIGSRTKTASVNRRLREAGIPEESIAQVHTPIGTAIQAVTPAEIAVSIAGEMILCRAERRGDKPHGCPMH